MVDIVVIYVDSETIPADEERHEWLCLGCGTSVLNIVGVTRVARVARVSRDTCPCSKDNVSWGEYQMTIPVAGSTAPIAVVLTFDAATTIVRAHRSL